LTPRPDLARELQAAVDAARAAGAVVRARRPEHVEAKAPIDLVTEVDRAAEDAVLGVIAAAFPGDGVLAEEKGDARPALSGRTWVVDPLDGTTNFVHGVERVAVSIALLSGRTWVVDPLDGTTNFVHGVERVAVSIALLAGGERVLGVVLDVFLDRLYAAVRGAGATCDGAPLAVSTANDLGAALMATGFPPDRRTRAAGYLEYVRAFMERTHGIRRFGSAALDLVDVASGRFDGFWEFGLKPWDTAAGTLIVEEAGGRVTTGDGAPWKPGDPLVVATNGRLHDAVVDVLCEVRRARGGEASGPGFPREGTPA